MIIMPMIKVVVRTCLIIILEVSNDRTFNSKL